MRIFKTQADAAEWLNFALSNENNQLNILRILLVGARITPYLHVYGVFNKPPVTESQRLGYEKLRQNNQSMAKFLRHLAYMIIKES